MARTVTLPLLKRLGVEDPGLELKIVKRGARPQGGGEVHLRVPFVKQLQPIQLTDEGTVKLICMCCLNGSRQIHQKPATGTVSLRSGDC